jgi:hypothetical protein
MSSITIKTFLTRTQYEKTEFWGWLTIEGDRDYIYNFWGKRGRETRLVRYAAGRGWGPTVILLPPRVLVDQKFGRTQRGWKDQAPDGVATTEPEIFAAIEKRLALHRITNDIPRRPRIKNRRPYQRR